MKKVESLLPVLLAAGLILILIYLGIILIIMAFSTPRVAQAFCISNCGGEEPPPLPFEVIHLARLNVGAHAPSRVAVDSQGRFYITDPERYRIIVTDANGQNPVFIEDCGYPAAIAVGPDGLIFLGDALTHAVFVLSPEGNFLHTLGDAENEFGWPHDIAVEPVLDGTGNLVSGRVYVADGPSHNIKVYDASTGAHLFNITGEEDNDGDGYPDTTPLSFPNAVAVDTNGLFLVVSDHNNERLQLFDTNGVWIRSVGSFTRPAGVAFDDDTNIYATDSFHSEVRVYDVAGGLLGTVGQFGEAPGDLKVPTGITVDPYGRLVVVSFNNQVLEVFGPTGFSNPPATVEPPAVLNLTHPCPNQPPVAFAGPDQVITDEDGDGVEWVTLDGSGSYDSDGSIASYDWFEGSVWLAGGANPAVLFNVGTHTLTLAVVDDDGATDTDEVIVEVTTVPPPPEIVGTVQYSPNTLVLSDVKPGRVFGADIWLPGCKTADIVVSTVVLNGKVPAELTGSKLKGNCKNGGLQREINFDRQAVANIIDSTGMVELEVTGWVGDYATFRASSFIEAVP